MDEFPAGLFAQMPRAYRDTVPDVYYPVAIKIEALAPPETADDRKRAAALFVDLMFRVRSVRKAAQLSGGGRFFVENNPLWFLWCWTHRREMYAGTKCDASLDARAGPYGNTLCRVSAQYRDEPGL